MLTIDCYSLFAIVLNVVLSRMPVRLNAAIAATAISAAINAYSTAVTPTRSRMSMFSNHMVIRSPRLKSGSEVMRKDLNFTLHEPARLREGAYRAGPLLTLQGRCRRRCPSMTG